MKALLLVTSLITTLLLHAGGFVAGTLVLTPAGHRYIEYIEPGDTVICSPNNSIGIVYETQRYTAQAVVYLIIDDELIGLAPDQLLYVPLKQRWIRAKNLHIGDALLTADGSSIPVLKTEFAHEDATFVQLSLDEPHTYFVSRHNILVHNIAFVLPQLTYVFGQGFIWPTLGGFMACAGYAVLNKVVNSVNNSSRSLFKKFKRPDKEAQQQSSMLCSVGGGDPRDPRDKDNSSSRHYQKPTPPEEDLYPHGIYKGEDAKYHGRYNNGKKSKAPQDGQAALNNSVLIDKESIAPARVGISYGAIVGFNQTSHSTSKQRVYHGFVYDPHALPPDVFAALHRNGMITHTGKIIKYG